MVFETIVVLLLLFLVFDKIAEFALLYSFVEDCTDAIEKKKEEKENGGTS